MLLTRAEIAPPYVLATGSMGSYIADQYAPLWPGEISGLVLIDPSPPRDCPGLAQALGLMDDSSDDAPEHAALVLSRRTVFAEQQAHVPQNRDDRDTSFTSSTPSWLRWSCAKSWTQRGAVGQSSSTAALAVTRGHLR
jgi:pimeloyl-ACP methyl ester carboxylesterase